jgi:hypothetical protein
VTLLTLAGPDTLRVRADASIELRVAADSSAVSGLVGTAGLASLEAAVARAEVEPLAAWPAGSLGAVLVARDGGEQGFIWGPAEQLSPAQADLLALLTALRDEALGEGSERVAILPTRLFAGGRQARVAGRTARVIGDRDALEALLGQELGGEPLLIPEVDFSREILLAVFAGPAMRPGAQVEIATQVSRTAGGYLLVPVTLHEPGAACAGDGSESPFQIVRMQRLETRIYFQWERLETACPGEEGSAR